MDCIVLAAGYATRLYPLTKNTPKPLLKVKDKTILDWLLDDIDKSGRIDRYIIVSNHKFYNNFKQWADNKKLSCPIEVVDDGTESNETRLGAVVDVQFAVKKFGIDNDLMVIAGDNVLDFSLCRFIEYFDGKKQSCIMRYSEPSLDKRRAAGVITLDENDLITSMEEKPAEPKSHWITPPFYIYTKNDVARLDEALESGCGKDAPGSLAAWLSANSSVFAMEMPGRRYDIGNTESYNLVQTTYNGIKE